MTAWHVASFFLAVHFGAVVGTQIDLRVKGVRSFSDTQKAEFAPIVLRDMNSVHGRSLWICNAYAHPSGLHVYNLGTQQRITDDEPLAYKGCMDKSVELRDGDKLDFRSNRRSVGIFRARGLPQSQVSLLLIPYRRRPSSIGASFDSHAFLERDASQVVVVDAYRGSKVGKVKIQETSIDQAKGGNNSQQAEDLQFKSVVSVNPGQYQILLQNASDTSVSSANLKIDGASSKYVVMRVGCEPKARRPGYKPAFPQELVVYTSQKSAGLALQLHCLVLFSALALSVLSLY
mmetsp:Transcript_77468/g.149675  ORF Transcript_77468/g.149675 Transcript_77468/m.149675 type:complete len:289 (+) Transcript_77468:85-951(+)|eukprot:CAMPEP_0172665310 /NCGR_PEP_ID=MMETSP1074-20121228/7169_1 /TAXON_ID=2916 /ORGANISM="Ceratium fusus, Strain PA161109" /LENGTH=288 /DNA_ID=CAMNT_0013481607 /DNA_START=82 /DNA_END=948 /DNA_ORIENTATION=+